MFVGEERVCDEPKECLYKRLTINQTLDQSISGPLTSYKTDIKNYDYVK